MKCPPHAREGSGVGIEVALEDDIEIFGADHAAFHRSEDLDVLEPMKMVFFRKFRGHELDDGAEDFFGCFLVQKLKITLGVIGDVRELSVVDFVGVGDDEGTRGLAEDLGEACHAGFAGGEKVFENIAGADAGELVAIADEDEAAREGRALSSAWKSIVSTMLISSIMTRSATRGFSRFLLKPPIQNPSRASYGSWRLFVL